MENMTYVVVTASDSASRGEREDKSGVWIAERLRALGGQLLEHKVLPDDREALAAYLSSCADRFGAALVITTGGTGLTARDITPEATGSIIERLVPGISEALRADGMKKTPHAMLSRGIAGIRGKTLIINLPGSLKAVQEGMSLLERILDHAIETVRSRGGVDCGSSCST